MLKLMKLTVKLLVLALAIAGGMYVYYNYFSSDTALSEDQTETRTLMGPPEQFAITYLPRGEGEDESMVRQEVWFYPSTKQKFSFLEGKLTGTEELELAPDADYSGTVLRPEDFDFYTTYEDLAARFGEANIGALDLPIFTDEEMEIRTYAVKDAMFIFEQGYLTYMETLD